MNKRFALLGLIGYLVIGIATAAVMKHLSSDCEIDTSTNVLMGLSLLFWPMFWLVGLVILLGTILCWIL